MSCALVFMSIAQNMPPALTEEVKGQIFALKRQGKSAFVVRKELLESNIDATKSAINKLWKKKSSENSPAPGNEAKRKRRRTKTVRTSEVIQKVKNMVKSDTVEILHDGSPRSW